MTVSQRWELGSEFHWTGMSDGPLLSWPKPAVWYQLGRHAVLALLEGTEKASTLWLPTYFCEDVAEAWARRARIRYYTDDPSRAHPDWQTLSPGTHDLVLAVNYFGMRNGRCWVEWHSRNQCILIEDHSHDSHSSWSRSSKADYAFCSLRKLYPVPDGAILWSPKGCPLPPEPQFLSDTGSSAKLAAMLLKKDYLEGRATNDLKNTFRRLQLTGEEQMGSGPISAVSPFSKEYLIRGVPRAWREVRRENALHLIDGLTQWKEAEPLFPKAVPGKAPFGFVVVFESSSIRDLYREKLRRQNVYCPIHWAGLKVAGTSEQDLAARVFTIPCDQRYSACDMQAIVSILRGRQHGH